MREATLGNLVLLFCGLTTVGCTAEYEILPALIVTLEEGAGRPCLGAAHVVFRLEALDPERTRYQWDRFGLTFDSTDLSCDFSETYRFDGVEALPDATLTVTLFDSSTTSIHGAIGRLAEGAAGPFAVGDSAGDQKVQVVLDRRNDTQPGTVLVSRPGTWAAVQQDIATVWFQVARQSDNEIMREGYLAYDRIDLPDPFPLAISNLPATEDENCRIQVGGFDPQLQEVATWTGEFFLVPGQVANAVWPE